MIFLRVIRHKVLWRCKNIVLFASFFERDEPNNKCKTVVDFDTLKLTESSLSEYIVPNKWDLLQPNAVMNLPKTSKTLYCESLNERTQILVQQSTLFIFLILKTTFYYSNDTK